MFSKDAGLLQGMVELLVLKRLSWGPMHGYGIASWIERVTDDVLRVEEGSLYPARDWLQISWLDVKLGLRMLVKYPGLTVVEYGPRSVPFLGADASRNEAYARRHAA